MPDTVQEILYTDILKVTSKVSIDFAISLVVSRKLDDLYVVDEQQHLLGIVPGFTLIKSLIKEENSNHVVEQIMSTHVVSCDAQISIAKIAPLFREACHERIAVVDHGKLIGQLRRCDVLHWLAKQAHQEMEPEEKTEHQAHIAPPHFLKSQQVSQLRQDAARLQQE